METKIKIHLIQFLIFCIILATSSCAVEDQGEFGIFSTEDGISAEMNGEITSSTPSDWANIIDEFPAIEMLTMRDCPGSSDDEANLQVAREMRFQDLHIHLDFDSEIASGAVDMFFAGTRRTRDSGSKIGVHSWADGDGNEATDFLEDDEIHRGYIEYYMEMGLTENEASAFYFFTINAAAAADIHWMTDQEVERYMLLTE